jgi:hypothetical protein
MDISLALMLDLGGTLVFALSGALLAVRKDFDVAGVAVLSISAGLGGGGKVLRPLRHVGVGPVIGACASGHRAAKRPAPTGGCDIHRVPRYHLRITSGLRRRPGRRTPSGPRRISD